MPLAPYTGSQSPHAAITATDQPCSSANSRNAAHASARCDTGPDRVGRHERDAVVHAVRDDGVAVAEPVLVGAQREVRERVGAVPLHEDTAPARATSAGTTPCGPTTAGRNASHSTESAMPMPTASSAGDSNVSSRCGSATDRSPNEPERHRAERVPDRQPRTVQLDADDAGRRSRPTRPANAGDRGAARRRRVGGRGEVGRRASRGRPRRAA